MRQFYLLSLGAALAALALSACDVVTEEPVDPHPFGVGNGKVMVFSDLAEAQQIDVTLGGESIGAVTRFVGCSGDVTDDSGLAVAVRPAGSYQISAQSTTGLSWQPSAVPIEEDEITRYVLRGRPSRYAQRLPDEIEGLPIFVADVLGGIGNVERDSYHIRVPAPDSARVRIFSPDVVQGDRLDILFNGTYLARNVVLGAEDLYFDLALTPNLNWIAFRLSQDTDADGTTASASLSWGDRAGDFTFFGTLRTNRWNGKNLLYEC